MSRPYIITISSEKGGVGKTTLATNLAVYLKALAEEVPVTLLSFDNHFTVDRMFRLSSKQPAAHVGHLFSGVAPQKLCQQGEYGVQIIPSCDNLGSFNHQTPKDHELARILSQSKLEGIVIIDTCPILDPYTRNALFAADRVIVPVKDAPSLENCQHLANFFSDHGITHSPLRLLPCLIDTRIRYKGLFTTSYQLIKAYAINRGYRCFEGFIAKSPKVESLATNPEGKVYPILTMGRGTDVHLQFNHLARQVYLEYLDKGPLRINEFSATQRERAHNLAQRENARAKKLVGHCLCCNRQLEVEGLKNAFYIESANRDICGFIEDDCFYDMVFNHLYAEPKSGSNSAVKQLFRETAQGAYFLLQRQDSTRVKLVRLDQQGEMLSQHISEIKSTRGLLRRGSPLLQNLVKNTLPDKKSDLLLLIKQSDGPAKGILAEANYARYQTVFSRARLDFEVSEAEDPQLTNPVFP